MTERGRLRKHYEKRNLLYTMGTSQQKIRYRRICGHQSKLVYTITNNIEVFEEPVPRTKKITHCAVKFEAGEEKIIALKTPEKLVVRNVIRKC